MPKNTPPAVSVPVIEKLYAMDDSCQQQLYIKGHIDVATFVELAKTFAPFAVVDPSKVKHWWMWFRPVDEAEGEDDLVSDQVAEFRERAVSGGEPVTVLDDWLPLWEHQNFHERHIAHGAP